MTQGISATDPGTNLGDTTLANLVTPSGRMRTIGPPAFNLRSKNFVAHRSRLSSMTQLTRNATAR